MEASRNIHMLEGQSTTRPPLFTGSNFAYWKARMRICLQCIDLDILDIVEKKYVKKLSSEMTEDERKLANLNIKAMNALICGLTPIDYKRVSTCATTHEIWEKLCITHEGTPQVKQSKISGLIHDYELFKMLPSDSIDFMFSRFTNIINELHGLDKVLENQEMCYKILCSLMPAWEPKATAIKEAHDLSTPTLNGLIGKLKVHEKKVKEKEEAPSKAAEVPPSREQLTHPPRIVKMMFLGHPTRKCYVFKDILQNLVNVNVLTLKPEQKSISTNLITVQFSDFPLEAAVDGVVPIPKEEMHRKNTDRLGQKDKGCHLSTSTIRNPLRTLMKKD
ncbi:uncharacterized protein LOC109826667 [Asparagus officinalis]|uniref:uncharacterized protein LOC109826667 n=1 Tax=Asparagus officinalis TaxID=4686 RepID=UPI00098DE2B3|nr:uncharacterized protein LOC109826667 [Asparagus officinalis]